MKQRVETDIARQSMTVSEASWFIFVFRRNRIDAATATIGIDYIGTAAELRLAYTF